MVRTATTASRLDLHWARVSHITTAYPFIGMPNTCNTCNTIKTTAVVSKKKKKQGPNGNREQRRAVWMKFLHLLQYNTAR